MTNLNLAPMLVVLDDRARNSVRQSWIRARWTPLPELSVRYQWIPQRQKRRGDKVSMLPALDLAKLRASLPKGRCYVRKGYP